MGRVATDRHTECQADQSGNTSVCSLACQALAHVLAETLNASLMHALRTLLHVQAELLQQST